MWLTPGSSGNVAAVSTFFLGAFVSHWSGGPGDKLKDSSGLVHSFRNRLRLNWVCQFPLWSWLMPGNSFRTPTYTGSMRSSDPPLDSSFPWWIEGVRTSYLELIVTSSRSQKGCGSHSTTSAACADPLRKRRLLSTSAVSVRPLLGVGIDCLALHFLTDLSSIDIKVMARRGDCYPLLLSVLGDRNTRCRNKLFSSPFLNGVTISWHQGYGIVYQISWLIFQYGVVVLLMGSPCSDQFLSLPWFWWNLISKGTAFTSGVTTGRYAQVSFVIWSELPLQPNLTYYKTDFSKTWLHVRYILKPKKVKPFTIICRFLFVNIPYCKHTYTILQSC